MAQDKDQKTLNVPPLRFPGFTDEWKKTTLGEIGSGFNYGLNAPAKEFDGVNKYIRITDIDDSSGAYIEDDKVSPNGILTQDYIVKDNDILLARTGASTGKSYLYNPNDGKLYFAGFLIRFNVSSANPYFVYSILHTRNYWKWVSIMSARSGQPGINSQEYSSYSLNIPSYEEQDRIASLLRLLDERITTQNKIIEDLKKLKSAIIDKVFCLPSVKQPNKRLDGFNGDWEIVKLSEICERMTDRNSDLKCNLVLTIAAQYGLVSQLDFFNKSVASENLSSYYVLKKGDFAYNKSYSGEYIWGAIKKLDYYEEGVLSPLYICFRPNKNMINSDFLAFYFETKKWHRGISEIAGEGARNHGLLNISVIDFFNTIHRIPSLTEQIRIATVIQTYQNKINNEERLLLQYQTQRKFLLSTIFI